LSDSIWCISEGQAIPHGVIARALLKRINKEQLLRDSEYRREISEGGGFLLELRSKGTSFSGHLTPRLRG
jgi:hypothetical protein